MYFFYSSDFPRLVTSLTRVAQKTVGYLPKGFLQVIYLVNYLVTYQVGKCREVNYLV